jgi:hypothetical protein
MGGRAGGGAAGGMGSRSRGGGIAYLAESDKAVKLNINVKAAYMGTDRSGEWASDTKDLKYEVWVPKSQIQGGKVSTWIQKQKVYDAATWGNPNKGFMGMKVVAQTGYFTDAKGKRLETFEKKWD